MTESEMRKAKAELHKVITDTVLSFDGTLSEDMEMYKYIIHLATDEIVKGYDYV